MVAFSSCSDDPKLYSDTDITGFKVRLGEGNYKQGTVKDGNIIEFKITQTKWNYLFVLYFSICNSYSYP